MRTRQCFCALFTPTLRTTGGSFVQDRTTKQTFPSITPIWEEYQNEQSYEAQESNVSLIVGANCAVKANGTNTANNNVFMFSSFEPFGIMPGKRKGAIPVGVSMEALGCLKREHEENAPQRAHPLTMLDPFQKVPKFPLSQHSANAKLF